DVYKRQPQPPPPPEPAEKDAAETGTGDDPEPEDEPEPHADSEPHHDSEPHAEAEAGEKLLDAESADDPQPELEGLAEEGSAPGAEADPADPTNPRLEVETPGTPGQNPEPEVEAPPEPPPLPVRPVRRIPASGERVGAYTLGESLGHGGFAHVYRAGADDATEVAVKVLTGLPDDARDRFEQEAQLLERLDGRGFPHFVASDMEAAQPWFAMELVPGSTLLERVRAQGPLSGRAALRLAEQVVDALLVLQDERCLHRDLKPANIMVDGERAVLIDLGIAKVFDAATSTQPAGTVSYMAPELFGRRVHPRSDVYSLGLLLVFATTGALPPDLNFLGRDLTVEDLIEPGPGTDPGQAPPEIDRHLLPLILAMTRYQPAHRPPLANIAGVVRARLHGVDADPTLLLKERLVADGVTAGERAAIPPTAVLAASPERPTKVLGADDTPPGRSQEPWHALVYDRELMNVLSEVHADGFDGAASQVIADHVAQLGADAADGHTPAEIKDWIWQAMRWRAATPPDGHADTLRGWRKFRKPEPAPPSYAPRTSPVKHLGPAPRTSSVKHLGPAPTTDLPATPAASATSALPRSKPPSLQPRSAQPRSAQPRSAQPGSTARPASPAPAGTPDVGATRPMPPVGRAPAPSAPARTQPVPARSPVRAPVPERPAPQGPAAPPPGAAPRPRRASRFTGALLRWIPRLLLAAAALLTVGVVGPTGLVSWLAYVTALPVGVVRPAEGPLVAAAALLVAAMLRSAGHRMHVWFYVLGLLLVSGGAVLLAG
ncbi:serine/threonine-protein kinase, partial [Myceligenerans indicum]